MIFHMFRELPAQTPPHLGGPDGFDLEQQIHEGHAHLFRVVVQAVLQRREQLLQQGVAHVVVQDNGHALRGNHNYNAMNDGLFF